jgi:enoyl-CoA hydratase
MKDYSAFPALKVEQAGEGGRVFIVSINRPDRMNALDPQSHTQVARIWRELDRDPDCRAIIFTGVGSAFCTGNDFKSEHAVTSEKGPQYRTMRARPGASKIVDYILEVEKPIVSMINGPAIGLGLILALLGDITVAADDAKLGDPHINIGSTAGDGGVLLLPLLLGMNRAKEMLLLGDLISGVEAARIGLVNHSVPGERLMDHTLDIANRLAAKAPYALTTTKVCLQMILRRRALDILDLSHLYSQLSMRTQDFREAVNAHKEKRTARFIGR